MSKQAYYEAAEFFIATVRGVQTAQWDEPGLGVWSVRDLVGHTARSIILIEEFAAQRADRADVASAAEHYHVSLAPEGIAEMIAERGRAAGQALGDDPLAAVLAAWERVEPIVESTAEDAVIRYTNGGIRLGDYLDTRVLELVVHSLDLANAIGADPEPPREALSAALHLLADLALDSGHGGQLALAATGRGILPDRFSVLG